MISTRIRIMRRLALALACTSLSALPSLADSAKSQVVNRELQSKNFAHNKVGTSSMRKMVVYLPASYEGSAKRYPVIYFLPNTLEGSYLGSHDPK